MSPEPTDVITSKGGVFLLVLVALRKGTIQRRVSGLGQEVRVCERTQHPASLTAALCALCSYILCAVNTTANVRVTQRWGVFL